MSQLEYARGRHVYCASDSLGIPGTLARRVIGVTCPPFRQLHLTWGFVVEGFLFLLWAFSGTFAWRVPGLIWSAFLAHSGRCIGGLYPYQCPPICLLHRLGVLPFSGFYFWCHLGSQFIFRFHWGVHAWRISRIPCSLRSIFFWRFSGALTLLPIVWPDA